MMSSEEMVTIPKKEYEELKRRSLAYIEMKAELARHIEFGKAFQKVLNMFPDVSRQWRENTPTPTLTEDERKEFVRSLTGKYRESLSSTEEFAKRKQMEIELEERERP